MKVYLCIVGCIINDFAKKEMFCVSFSAYALCGGSFHCCSWFTVKRKPTEESSKREIHPFKLFNSQCELCLNFFFWGKNWYEPFCPFSMFIHFWWRKGPKSIQAYSPKCQRIISSYLQKVFVYSYQCIVGKRVSESESKLKMNYECFVPVYQSIWLH